MYYKPETIKQYDNTLDRCDLRDLFNSCYKNHTGIALNERLIRRLDASMNWNGIVQSERAIKQLLNGRKVKPVVNLLIEG